MIEKSGVVDPVQFGRGFVLSLRKVDELGIDTTVRGGKLTWTSDPFSVTLVGGILNPTKVDEATGRALVLSRGVSPDAARGIQGDRFGPQPFRIPWILLSLSPPCPSSPPNRPR